MCCVVWSVAAGVSGLPVAAGQSVRGHPVGHGDGPGRRVRRPGESSQEDEEGQGQRKDGHPSSQPGASSI